jgi:pimeloyl-ACP methyl ester carboxylesterase
MKLFVVIVFALLAPVAAGQTVSGVQGQQNAQRPATARPRAFLKVCGPAGQERWCGRYEVAEDRASGRGRKIALNIIVLPALTKRAVPDPVFFLAGGPGQGAASLAEYVGEGYLSKVRGERDLVFVDQRGTGESNPLSCDLYGEAADLRDYFESMFPAERVRTCRQQLEKVADLRQYTTSVAVDDLDEVRRALGYGKINLYGGSYGTTVALAYLRRYGRHVRSAVLAGVAPPDFKLPLPFAQGGEAAMARVIKDCAEEAGCRAAFPKLKEELDVVIARLEASPVTLKGIDPETGQVRPFSMGRGVFAERLRLLLFAPPTVRLVPLLIHRAYLGDFKPFVQAALPQAQAIYQSLSIGMYFTVTCSEGAQLITEDDIRRETVGTFLGDYRLRVHLGACKEWPRGVVPRGFMSPVESDAPVLILSNEADPASPRAFGAEVAQHLPNGRQVTIPLVGHNYFSPCVTGLALDFIAKGSARKLDTTCLESLRHPPFALELPEETPNRGDA